MLQEIISKYRRELVICFILSVAALAAFGKVSQCDFISYDDNFYVTENDHIKNGFTADAIQWAVTTIHTGYWHPLTWLSLMFDYQLFGMNPAGYHIVNLLLHIANTLLLFLILLRMTKKTWQSAFVAGVFALHPLHVESVAWVAERKDVLSAFFFLLTLGTYLYYVEHPGYKRYLFVFLSFVLGLMSKPIVVILPFVLLLLDYWPLQRLQQNSMIQKPSVQKRTPDFADKRKGKSSKKSAEKGFEEAEKPDTFKFQWSLIRPLLWEKVPLFVLTAFLSIATYVAQQREGAMRSIEAFPWSVRFANACISYITYIGKTVWPSNLAVLYPHPGVVPIWQTLSAVILLIFMTLLVAWSAKKAPYLAVGWLWYLGTLVPVIGIVQVGMQSMADRYTYIPMIGLLIMTAWGIPELLKTWRYRKEVLATLSTVVILCFFMATRTQVEHWRNSFSLFDHTLKVTSHNSIMYYNRGNAFLKIGKYERAIEDYNSAAEINPTHADIYYNRGFAHGKLGNYEQAMRDYGRTVELDPRNAKAYTNLGIAYGRLGEYKQAVGNFDRAIGLNPKSAEAYYNRAVCYYSLGNQRLASEDMRMAARFGNEEANIFLRNRGMN